MDEKRMNKLKKTLEQNRVSLDELQEYIYNAISINVLTNEEVAALFMSTFMQVLDKPHNQALLKQLKVDEVDLGIASELMKVWTESYATKVANKTP